MEDFKATKLWASALAERDQDHEEPRARLRAALMAIRDRAATVASTIPDDLKDFTCHDISHSDGLWEMADIIAGPKVELTPTEAFVLGGAFLIHDLGLALAVYPSGFESLRGTDKWLDTVTALLRANFGHSITREEVNDPPPFIENLAKEEVLRELHAERARGLLDAFWQDQDHDETYYLLEDADLRRDYGPLIGELAASHGWPISKLPVAFTTQFGAPVWCPREWTIDPIKLGALLRVSDAAHLTASRAPGFLRAVRKPAEPSRRHWVFQEHLHRPIPDGDRLKYTSTRAFPLSEASAWWLCLDSLRMVDRELRQSAALLADLGRERFQIRGVSNVDSPDRLATLVPTEGWLPVDTHLEVGDVAGLIERLGGRELYGDDPKVPLRELIQNASDAVRARIAMGDMTREQSRIMVRLVADESGRWIEVEDNGVGMSEQALTGPLLDFGKSYWGSALMRRELPGLLSRGFQATGKYGIGFFSAFMWGTRVVVTSRHYDDSRDQTRVLEFENGLRSRPILRAATPSERIRDGGSRVRVWLDRSPIEREGLLSRRIIDQPPWSLTDLCVWLCPALEVNLFTIENNGEPELAVKSADWINVSAEELLSRISEYAPGSDEYETRLQLSRILAPNVRPLSSSGGDIVGRACICPADVYGYRVSDFPSTYASAAVVAGGLRTGTVEPGVYGVLVGTAARAARDVAVPLVENEELARWATEQAHLIRETISNPQLQSACAETVLGLLGDPGDLPIAYSADGWLTLRQITSWCKTRDEIYVTDLFSILGTYEDELDADLNGNVLGVEGANRPFVRGGSSTRNTSRWPEPPPDVSDEEWSQFYLRTTAYGAIAGRFAEAWSATLQDVIMASTYLKGTEDEREIGKRSEVPVVRDVTIFRLPTKQS